MSGVSSGTATMWGIPMKWLSLVLLVIQTTSLVTTIRYSMTTEGPKYLATTAVFWMELIKLFTAVLVTLYQSASVNAWITSMSSDVFGSWQELGKLAVPSVIYIIQNNLLYLAIANLDAPTYQVVYNAKILTTGLFSYLLLGKRLSPVQWGSLVILMIGVSAAQYDPGAGTKVLKDGSNRTLGLLFVAVACITSGFAGVYFEKVLKSSQTSLWIRNIQMSMTSVPLALASAYFYDGPVISERGFNQGYTWMVWQIVFNQAVGGLLIAVVMKYADNLLKAFAAAISIVSSSLIAAAFFDFSISIYFVFGSFLVLFSSYVYSAPSAVIDYLPTWMKDQPLLPTSLVK